MHYKWERITNLHKCQMRLHSLNLNSNTIMVSPSITTGTPHKKKASPRITQYRHKKQKQINNKRIRNLKTRIVRHTITKVNHNTTMDSPSITTGNRNITIVNLNTTTGSHNIVMVSHSITMFSPHIITGNHR